MWADIVSGRELAATETRTVAREWMLENIPPGSRILMEVETPQLPIEQYAYFEVRPGRNELVRVDRDNHRHRNYWPVGRIGKLRQMEALKREGIQYVVMGDMYDRYLAEKDTYPEIVATYEKVMEAGELMYELRPQAGVNRGPVVRIYRIWGDG